MAFHNHAHHQHRRDRVQNAHQEVRRQDTLFNVVYVTASPTFTGTYSPVKHFLLSSSQTISKPPVHVAREKHILT